MTLRTTWVYKKISHYVSVFQLVKVGRIQVICIKMPFRILKQTKLYWGEIIKIKLFYILLKILSSNPIVITNNILKIFIYSIKWMKIHSNKK